MGAYEEDGGSEASGGGEAMRTASPLLASGKAESAYGPELGEGPGSVPGQPKEALGALIISSFVISYELITKLKEIVQIIASLICMALFIWVVLLGAGVIGSSSSTLRS
jgi:hypothetical protein